MVCHHPLLAKQWHCQCLLHTTSLLLSLQWKMACLAESGETKIGVVSPLPNPWIPYGLWTTAALKTESREANGGQGGILQLHLAISMMVVNSDLLLRIGFNAQNEKKTEIDSSHHFPQLFRSCCWTRYNLNALERIPIHGCFGFCCRFSLGQDWNDEVSLLDLNLESQFVSLPIDAITFPVSWISGSQVVSPASLSNVRLLV
jgi:hypothetical protein